VEELHPTIQLSVAASPKIPLDREALRDVIDLTLWTGQLLLQHGADTDRIEETVHRLGTSLGADWLDILISPNAIIATTISGEEFRTKIRRVVSIGVNMTILTEINELSRRVDAGELDRHAVRLELARIGQIKSNYNRWVIVLSVGLACAALSRLLGGDWISFGVTFAASSMAMFVRQTLAKQFYNPLLVVILTAFVAGGISGALVRLLLNGQANGAAQTAQAASVLLLVPGVPLINALQDMIKGHLITGIARGVTGALVSMAIALGLLLAISVVGGGV